MIFFSSSYDKPEFYQNGFDCTLWLALGLLLHAAVKPDYVTILVIVTN